MTFLPLLAVALLLSPVPPGPQAPAARGAAAETRPPAQELAAALQKRYDSVHDFSADFVHESEGGLLRKKQSESGVLQVKKPGRMRWDYKKPEPKVFVSDGRRIYLYIPADNQVVISPVPDEDQATTAVLFLVGKGNLARDFKVSYVEGGSAETYTLRLRAASAGARLRLAAARRRPPHAADQHPQRRRQPGRALDVPVFEHAREHRPDRQGVRLQDSARRGRHQPCRSRPVITAAPRAGGCCSSRRSSRAPARPRPPTAPVSAPKPPRTTIAPSSNTPRASAPGRMTGPRSWRSIAPGCVPPRITTFAAAGCRPWSASRRRSASSSSPPSSTRRPPTSTTRCGRRGGSCGPGSPCHTKARPSSRR